MKYFLPILILILGASRARAQSVSPIYAEAGHKANGEFQITNNTVQPMVVSLEAYSFSLDAKGQHFRKLDGTTHLVLSETSARLSPKEVYSFSYRITCDVLPCYTTILSGMIVGHTQGDKDHPAFQVRLVLPTSIYQDHKAKDARKHALEAAGLLAQK